MATQDLKQADYNALLAGDGFDTTGIADLDLALHGHRAVVQADFAQQGDTLVPDAGGDLAQLLVVNGSVNGSDTVNTDLDAALKAIGVFNGDHLTVTGTGPVNVSIATDATAGDAVFLQDVGNDNVTLHGSGQEVIGGVGRDTLVDQGTGGNSLFSGTGAGTVAIDASSGGGDGLIAQGSHQILMGEANDHVIIGGSFTNDMLMGGSFEADFGGSSNMLVSAVAGATFNLNDQGGDTVLASGANATINEFANNGANTLIATGAGVTMNVNGLANDTLIGATDHSTLVNSSDVSTDIVSQVLNTQTGVTTMTLGSGQVLQLANITAVTFSGDGVTVAVDPPSNVNNQVADVVAAAQHLADQAATHVAAVEAHWAHA